MDTFFKVHYLPELICTYSLKEYLLNIRTNILNVETLEEIPFSSRNKIIKSTITIWIQYHFRGSTPGKKTKKDN